uniref:Adenylosuccinate synthetase n=1 Tax=Romanomermis culicivorax TaxID=13658 RepID=A0A915J7H5_ROMCU
MDKRCLTIFFHFGENSKGQKSYDEDRRQVKQTEQSLLYTNLKDFGRVEVIYETFPGWMVDTSKIRDFSNLPEKAQNYVKFIENFVKVPIRWVGIGQDRKALISRL